MRLFWTVSVIFLLTAARAPPARACDAVVILEPTESPAAATPIDKRLAPPGGVWWLTIPTDIDIDELALQDEQAAVVSSVADAVVGRGPRSLALRVPPDAEPGQAFTIVFPEFTIQLTVDDEDTASVTDSPVISAVRAVPVAEVRTEGCGIGFPQQQRVFSTLADVELSLPAGLSPDDVLLDVWIVPTGAPVPDELAERPFDKLPARMTGVSSDAGAAFRVVRVGQWDVHVRATDPRTGLSSTIQSVAIINDRQAEPLPPDFTRWSWGCSSTNGSPSLALLPLCAAFALGRAIRKRKQGSKVRASVEQGMCAEPSGDWSQATIPSGSASGAPP